MPGDYEEAISIKSAMDNIVSRRYLLPAIQRKFEWSTHQICELFDSIMRGYPISTFMMWDVTSQKLKEGYRFYEFLKSYCQRFGETNPYFETRSHSDFKAVIDGQQRLTSIYIGLNGTYAYKQPRIWWPTVKDDKTLPPRRLYIDLLSPLDQEDSLMQYNFRFLTQPEYESSSQNAEVSWYEVGRILSGPDVFNTDEMLPSVVLPILKKMGLETNEYARETLTRLYVSIRQDKIIHYYNETSQEIDHVLDVFIRTNSGGTSLAFSDLLMSIAVANWKGDAREDIDQLTKQIWQSSEMGFSVDRDWILKACLTLTGSDVKFRVKNFTSTQVEAIENQWDNIRSCIVESFKLVRLLGLNDQSLRAKNAVIPIAFYLYTRTSKDRPLYERINNLTYHINDRREIGRWLHMSLLKGVFGSQSDTILTKLRKIIDENKSTNLFPLHEIVAAYKSTNKDLRFDDDYITNLLATQYGDNKCRSVLSLLFPEINENQLLHIDHLHPKSFFTKTSVGKQQFLDNNDELREFYLNPSHWNTLPNLHLLNASQNCAKNDKPLEDWIADPNNGFKIEDLLINASCSLNIEDFKLFYDARMGSLKSRLKTKLFTIDHSLVDNSATIPDDEQV